MRLTTRTRLYKPCASRYSQKSKSLFFFLKKNGHSFRYSLFCVAAASEDISAPLCQRDAGLHRNQWRTGAASSPSCSAFRSTAAPSQAGIRSLNFPRISWTGHRPFFVPLRSRCRPGRWPVRLNPFRLPLSPPSPLCVLFAALSFSSAASLTVQVFE